MDDTVILICLMCPFALSFSLTHTHSCCCPPFLFSFFKHLLYRFSLAVCYSYVTHAHDKNDSFVIFPLQKGMNTFMFVFLSGK